MEVWEELNANWGKGRGCSDGSQPFRVEEMRLAVLLRDWLRSSYL